MVRYSHRKAKVNEANSVKQYSLLQLGICSLHNRRFMMAWVKRGERGSLSEALDEGRKMPRSPPFFFYLIKVDPLILFRSLASISIILITRFARKLPGCVHQFCIPRGVRAMPRRLQQRKDDPGGHNCNVTANRCPGARFSKIPVIFRARNQIFNSTHKNKGADPGQQTTPFCFIS